VYPAPFDYFKAASWAEAVALLQEYGDDAKVLAGGQSLIPMLSLRLIRPNYVIDVNGADNAGIREANGMIEIGALTRHAELERSPILKSWHPIIGEAAAHIGNRRVRHRGTIGGSLAHADPSAELTCVATALGAEVRILGPAGTRSVPATSFFVSYFSTALEPAEVIVSVGFPKPTGNRGSAFIELSRRVGDFATLAVAAVVDVDQGRDVCTGVRLVFAAMADRPVDLSEAASPLIGRRLDEGLASSVAGRVAETADPRADHRGSTEYRRRLASVLTTRALHRAWDRAVNGTG
jgi:carbon-monoxide dehydrogenase medium subunit